MSDASIQVECLAPQQLLLMGEAGEPVWPSHCCGWICLEEPGPLVRFPCGMEMDEYLVNRIQLMQAYCVEEVAASHATTRWLRRGVRREV